MDKDLPVLCYDMKGLVVGDSQFIGCYWVPWKDIRLVESEKIVQALTVNKITDNSKKLDRHKRYTPMFGPKSKTNQQG
jgi:hypothetical protein